jgi:hypothetical protein
MHRVLNEKLKNFGHLRQTNRSDRIILQAFLRISNCLLSFDKARTE